MNLAEADLLAKMEAAPAQQLSRSEMDEVAYNAAVLGCVPTLARLLETASTCQGGPWTPGERQCRAAAEAGQIAVLEWLRERVSPGAWGYAICTAAARANQVEALRWLQTVCSPASPFNEGTMEMAAQQGHLDVMKYLRSLEPPCRWNDRVLLHAVKRGDLAMVEWLCQQDPPCPQRFDYASIATSLGGSLGLKVLQCLLSRGQPSLTEWEPACTEHCAALGDLATLQCLHGAGFSLSTECPGHAAEAGHIDVLRWLLSIGIQPEIQADVYASWPAPTVLLWADYGLPHPVQLTKRLQRARASLCTFHGLIRWRRTWLKNAGSVSNAAKSRSAFCGQGCRGEQLLTLLARLPNEIITKIAVAAGLQHDFPVPA